MSFRPSAAPVRQRWLLPLCAVASLIPTGQALAERGQPEASSGKAYQIRGQWYYPTAERTYDRRGTASWYGAPFHGRRTANGEVYNMHALTAAHPTLPLPSYAYVTNTSSGRTVLVRVNDRGPFVGGRMIDLSREVAKLLGFIDRGTAPVRVVYDGPAPKRGNDARERQYLASQDWQNGRGTTKVAAAAPQLPQPQSQQQQPVKAAPPADSPPQVAAASPQAVSPPLPAAPASTARSPAAKVASQAVPAPTLVQKARAGAGEAGAVTGGQLVAALEAEAVREVETIWRAALSATKSPRRAWR